VNVGAPSEPQASAPPTNNPGKRPQHDPPWPEQWRSDTTVDRCLANDCDPIDLPPQPELTFLEELAGGWHRFMEADWALAPTSEGYRCMKLTLPHDVYIVAFSHISPPGTHHASFGITDRSEPDGVYACAPGVGGTRSLQGSGAGGGAFELPASVAMHLRAGEQVTMNLHLFNATDEILTGRSGLRIKTVPRDMVRHEASSLVAGAAPLMVPPGRSLQRGGCTFDQDATLFSVGPHMHQLGVYMRIQAKTADGLQTLHEGPFDFYHQVHYPIAPLSLQAGDRIEVECTYENPTDRTVMLGDGSLDEMCFVFLGMYPAVTHKGFPCVR
ncbi:MAG: hypothetical protein OXU20_38715, partial [Myxococcales bacterium]|nr:hypothetical protein [Myxococcales bacterium]